MPIAIPGLDHLSDDTLFNICSISTIPGWLVLALLPRSSMRRAVVYPIILFNCLVYAATFVTFLVKGAESPMDTFSKFNELSGVQELFRDGGVVLPGWVHYIAFDLTVGIYLTEKNNANPDPIPQLLMFPILFMTLMAGPIGALMYFVVRAFYTFVLGNNKPAEKQS